MFMSGSTENFDNLFHKNKMNKTIVRNIAGKFGDQGYSLKENECLAVIIEQDFVDHSHKLWDKELEFRHDKD